MRYGNARYGTVSSVRYGTVSMLRYGSQVLRDTVRKNGAIKYFGIGLYDTLETACKVRHRTLRFGKSTYRITPSLPNSIVPYHGTDRIASLRVYHTVSQYTCRTVLQRTYRTVSRRVYRTVSQYTCRTVTHRTCRTVSQLIALYLRSNRLFISYLPYRIHS